MCVSATLFAKETVGAGGVNEWPATVAVQETATQPQHTSQAGGPGFDGKRARAAGEPLAVRGVSLARHHAIASAE